jgi:hypothetical protein
MNTLDHNRYTAVWRAFAPPRAPAGGTGPLRPLVHNATAVTAAEIGTDERVVVD